MFEQLLSQIKEKGEPLTARNEDGEVSVVSSGENDNGFYIEVDTYQKNGWIRINLYYENGDTEELYRKDKEAV